MQYTTYKQAGVDVEAGDRFVGFIKSQSRREGHKDLLPAAGGYAAVYPIVPDRLIALTTDGVGTKVLVAHQFNKHHGIGIDLVAMCANDLICVGARPALFLDYYATGALEPQVSETLIKGILDGCDQAGMLLVGGETAEMPDVYEGAHYDLAGFAVGELNPDQLITGKAIQPGQTVIGLASTGIHSNGLSLARKILSPQDQEAFLLEPTKIYVKPVMQVLKQFPGIITGICHVTGGGWQNLFRLNSQIGFEITTPLQTSPVFNQILSSGIALDEAYRTFNMGMGLAIIVSQSDDQILKLLQEQGVQGQIIGKTTANPGVLEILPYKITLKTEGTKQ